MTQREITTRTERTNEKKKHYEKTFYPNLRKYRNDLKCFLIRSSCAAYFYMFFFSPDRFGSVLSVLFFFFVRN